MNRFKEVLYPLSGDWVVEVYAWSKELARLLHVPFHVVFDDPKSARNLPNPKQQLLEGDGYYFSHYSHSPPKTEVSSLPGDFASQLVPRLSRAKSSVVMVGPSIANSDIHRELFQLNHLIASYPKHIQRANEIPEFDNILQQIAFHHLPKELFQNDNHSLFSRMKRNLLSIR